MSRGAKAISEALKINTTLTELNLRSDDETEKIEKKMEMKK